MSKFSKIEIKFLIIIWIAVLLFSAIFVQKGFSQEKFRIDPQSSNAKIGVYA